MQANQTQHPKVLHWIALTLALLLFRPSARGDFVVFATDFNDGVPAQFSGVTNTEPVQGYAGIGPNSNQFGGLFLRNTSLSSPTTLTLAGLPMHTNINLRFLLALIDTWDGSSSAPGAPIPDFFNVSVDGITIFSHTFKNYNRGGSQTYVPPDGVLLTPSPFPELGFAFRGDPPDFGDTAYNLGADPTFLNIPHTASSLTVSWFTSGAGWQGGDDESWAIDNVSVSIDADPRDDLRARLAVSCVDICWPGRTNKTYQVQYRSELAPDAWLNLGAPVTGTGTNCVTDSVEGRARRIYRIQEAQ